MGLDLNDTLQVVSHLGTMVDVREVLSCADTL